MGRKEKVRHHKRPLIILGILLGALLIIFLSILLIKFLVVDRFTYYEVDSRVENIKKSQKDDDDENVNTVGWIKIQGTNIDMPVLEGRNDDFNYPVEREEYSWMYGTNNKFYNKVNIYGHNIFNLGSSPKINSERFKRFEELMAFIYPDFAKENKYIQFTIDGEDYVYKIFSVGFLYAGDVVIFPEGENSKSELKEQIDLLKEESIYDYDIDVNEEDKLISVVTCTRFLGDYRYIDLVVSGRLLRNGERMSDYSLEKNDKYREKVESVLKGDGNDETDSV